MTTEIKKTPFYEKHVQAGGKIVEFAGFYLPVQYVGLIEEHKAVRERAGLFDVSHMGQAEVKGKDALAAVNRLVTNDVRAIVNGQAMYAMMTNEQGGIVDDLVVYRVNEEHIFICWNAANDEKDYKWLSSHIQGDVKTEHNSHLYGQLALQGPLAEEILQKLTTVNLKDMGFYYFSFGEVAGVKNCLVSRTGYTGEPGFEIYMDWEKGPALWDAIAEEGKKREMLFCGLGCRDTLRLEMKYPLYGNDIDDTTTPLEANLRWAVKFKKEESFTAKEIIDKQRKEGVKRKLIGFKMTERGIPRHGYKIFAPHGEGVVTSGTMSPSLNEAIGMAYVPTEDEKEGTALEVEIRGKRVKAEVVKTPFYQKAK